MVRCMNSFEHIAVLLLPLCILLTCVTPAGALSRVDTGGEKLIALSFDDGPDPKHTGEILDILSKYEVRATFFIVGSNAENNPGLVLRAQSEGHEIGSHTYSHMNGKKKCGKEYGEDIRKNEALLSELLGFSPVLFRPPGGNLSREHAAVVSNMGYTTVLWSVDTEDWRGNSAEKIEKTVFGSVKNGDIILMHDCIYGDSHTAEALEKIIPELLGEGYRFVTVSELISADQKIASAQ